jgi:hypothetical protein
VSTPAICSNGSNVDYALNSGGLKTTDAGSSVEQQHQRSDLIQKDTILEPNLQNGKGNSTHAEDDVSRDGPKNTCTKNIYAKGTSLHADLEPYVRTRLEKAAPATCESADASASQYPGSSVKVGAGGTTAHSLKIGEYPSNERIVANPKTGDIDGVGCGTVQGNAAGREAKNADNVLFASPSTSISMSLKSESANMHTVSAMRSIVLGTPMSLSPAVFKSDIGTSTRCWHSHNRSRHQQRVFSAKQGMYSPLTIIC